MSSNEKRRGNGRGNSIAPVDDRPVKPPRDKKRSMQTVMKAAIISDRALEAVINAKRAASKWRHYVCSKRQLDMKEERRSPISGQDAENKHGEGLSEIHSDFVKTTGTIKSQAAKNRALIQYFSKLGQADCREEVDLDFVSGLIEQGADINATDRYGQSIFHEVARIWSTDIARFLLEHNAKLNVQDFRGRTPLHVAAAVDYADMCQYLIDKGADKEAVSSEKQTPLHFAARTDAVRSLACLIKSGCEYKHVKDYRGRTPLYVAAELDRSETARYLIERKAPVGVCDEMGQPALTCMIEKMAPVAKLALDQLHHKDRANRQQQFYLNHLEPLGPGDERIGYAKMPLEILCIRKNFELVLHPIMLRLINIKWRSFGKFGAFRALALQVLFVALWSSIALHSSWYEKCHYDLGPNAPDVWKIIIYILAVGLTIYQIVDELREFWLSQKEHNRWKEWRLKQINRDIAYCHPMWPKEEEFLRNEIEDLDKRNKPSYHNDFWNIFDWCCYIFLMASTTSHLLDVFITTPSARGYLAVWHNRIMAVNIILVWLRFMKYVRCFSLLGPFVVMLGEMATDIVRFLFLYFVFFIPFSMAMWMIFGNTHNIENILSKYDINGSAHCIHENLNIVINAAGTGSDLPNLAGNTSSTFHIPTVKNMDTVDKLLFTMFRLTLVDEYDLDNMLEVDKPMTYVLLGLWLAISAVLCLNLLIALLSDTFQRVYDNAKANAVMQKALTILNIEENLRESRLTEYRLYIKVKCSPKVDIYDDDTGEQADELQKITIQTYEKVEEIYDLLAHKSGPNDVNEFPSARGGGDLPDDPAGDQEQPSTEAGKKPTLTQEKLENEVDILRAELSAVEKKRREFEKRCLSELRQLKSVVTTFVQGQGQGQIQGQIVPRQYLPATLPPLMMADSDGAQYSGHEQQLPAYPAMMAERLTPREDQTASVTNVDVNASEPHVDVYPLRIDSSDYVSERRATLQDAIHDDEE